MPWFVVDDSAHSHPKLIKAGNAAVGLWMRCGSYAAQHLTDGIVPGAVAAMYGTAPQTAKLVKLGLWHPAGHVCPSCVQPADGDYIMHDYLSYNPNRKQVLARRAKAAERQRRHRGQTDSGPPEPPTNRERFNDESAANRERIEDESHPIHTPVSDEYAGHSNGSRGDERVTRARAFPSPPLPSTTDVADVGGESAGSEAREAWPEGPPAPIDIDGFTVTGQMRRWANAEYPNIDLQHSTNQFVAHYRSTGTRRKNWPEAWRKWIAEDSRRSAGRPQQGAFLVPLQGGNTTPRRSTADERVAQGQALAAMFREEEQRALEATRNSAQEPA